MARSRSGGSHYALTAIGLGMLVLGVIMAVWNLVPGFGLSAKPHPTTNNHSNKTEVDGGMLPKSKTFSVAYVLVGSGILLLLLSVCLNIRDRRKQRQEESITRIRPQVSVEPPAPEDSQEEDDETLSRYYVPSYEEVVNGNYSERRAETEQGTRISMSLPSYESLTGLDDNLPTRPASVAPETSPSGERRQPSKRLKPLKVRRIKSEKLHLKKIQNDPFDGNSSGRVTIEPLTPPPQYDEVPQKLPGDQEEP